MAHHPSTWLPAYREDELARARRQKTSTDRVHARGSEARQTYALTLAVSRLSRGTKSSITAAAAKLMTTKME